MTFQRASVGLSFLVRDSLYLNSRLSISFFGTARTRLTKSSNALNSFGFLMLSSYAFRASGGLGWSVLGARCFLFPGQLFECDALSDNARKREHEAVLVVTKTFVESESLFVQIAKCMERLNTDVRSLDATFQQRPKVLNPVSVNCATHVLFSMANEGMDESVVRQAVVGTVFVGIDVRTLGPHRR
jgi:hypothetical protein